MSDNNDFAIDQSRLNEEWLQQAELYHSYAVRLADARRKLEDAKNQLARTEAELQITIRQDPSSFGLPKVTESSIAAAVTDDAAYIKAQNTIVAAKYKVDLLQADCTALDHKRKALENLVSLHGMDYFSIPRARDEAGRRGVQDIETDEAFTRGKRRRKRSAPDE